MKDSSTLIKEKLVYGSNYRINTEISAGMNKGYPHKYILTFKQKLWINEEELRGILRWWQKKHNYQINESCRLVVFMWKVLATDESTWRTNNVGWMCRGNFLLVLPCMLFIEQWIFHIQEVPVINQKEMLETIQVRGKVEEEAIRWKKKKKKKKKK